MILATIGLVVGLALLVWSADKFTWGASALANILGVSALVIGILVVGVGTSAPEMLVAALASFQGQPDLAVGNAIGSNIANIALILGATAVFVPLTVRSEILRKELPLMLVVLFFAGWLLMVDGELDRLDGVLLLLALGLFIYRQFSEAKRNRADFLAGQAADDIDETATLSSAIFWLITGLVVLMGSAQLLVWSATQIATALGISELIIGLTVVAIGTSLPELAACLAAARRQDYDIVLGNVIGSNLFNILAVLPLPGLIAPGPVLPEVIHRDYPVMLLLSLLLILFAWGPGGRQQRINRIEGGVLLTIYIGYLSWLVMQAVG